MDWWNTEDARIDEFVGKTPVSIINTGEEILFRMNDGTEYVMAHYQSCCERVYVEDIAGDLNDLLNTPITLAEERSNRRDTKYGDEQWTFYEMQSSRGYVTIRWYGSSNGYYGTGVDIRRKAAPSTDSTPAF